MPVEQCWIILDIVFVDLDANKMAIVIHQYLVRDLRLLRVLENCGRMDKCIEGMWRGHFGDVWASLEGAWPEGALWGNGALGEEAAKSLTLAVLLGTGGVFFAKDMPKWAFDVFSERKFF